LNVTINNSETTAPDCTCDTSCPRLIAGSFKFVFSPPDTTPVPVLFRPLPDLDLESSWSATFNCSCCYKCKCQRRKIVCDNHLNLLPRHWSFSSKHCGQSPLQKLHSALQHTLPPLSRV
jgi:hypothetical protein